MSNYKNLEDIKKEFKKRIDEQKTLLEAWEKVERVTKKDGSDFVALAKNFKNATVKNNEFVLRPSKQIQIYGITKNNKYVDDSIETTELVKYSKRPVDADRVLKESYLEPWYEKTVDEIFEDIEAKKEILKKNIKNYEQEILVSEKYYMLIECHLESIHNILNELSAKGQNSGFLSLRYALEDIVKNHYFR